MISVRVKMILLHSFAMLTVSCQRSSDGVNDAGADACPSDSGGIEASTPLCVADDYGRDRWETHRGPFGGDRRSVATDPSDVDHLFVDSVDRSGFWESRDRGETWSRANPPGAPFAQSSTRVATLVDQSGKSWLVLTALEPQGPSIYRVPMASASTGPVEQLSAFSAAASQLAVDPAPERPGRLAAVIAPESGQQAYQAGGVGVSADAGLTWTRFNPGGHPSVIDDIIFAGDGTLVVSVLLSVSLQELSRVVDERGAGALAELSDALKSGKAAPSWISEYDFNRTPRILQVSPADGTILHSLEFYAHRLSADPRRPAVLWGLGAEGAIRISGQTMTEVPIRLADGTTLPQNAKAAGITVTLDPDSAEETVFLTISGANASARGIYRGREEGEQWVFSRVSAGATREFSDFPKEAVVVARADGRVVFAPYAEEGLQRSNDFGAPDSWGSANHGLTGYNIFAVEESPTDPSLLLASAQNVVAINRDRLQTPTWSDTFVELDIVTANVRGGVEVDPDNPSRWLLGAGAGALINYNGGVWLSEDAGKSWERVVGSPNDERNPQVNELYQHADHPDWVLFSSAQHMGRGDPGLFSSLSRGAKGSFTKVVEGAAWTIAPLATDAVLAGGAFGLMRLSIQDGKVATTALPFDGEVVTASCRVADDVIVGTEGGALYQKSFAELEAASAWTQVADFGVKITDLAASAAHPGVVYAGTDGGGIFRSDDGGATFLPHSEGLESSELTVFDLEISACGDRVYAGTLGGLAVRRL